MFNCNVEHYYNQKTLIYFDICLKENFQTYDNLFRPLHFHSPDDNHIAIVLEYIFPRSGSWKIFHRIEIALTCIFLLRYFHLKENKNTAINWPIFGS